jgi:pyruvoyl-dependent arginine decarboxylase (PvlArgDC)
MFRSRIRLGWSLAVVVVLAAALMPAAGATVRGIQPTSPWYAYDAALRNAQHQRQHVVSSVQPTSPWYAYDAALRKAKHQRQRNVISRIQPTSPWYAFDAALRKAQQQRLD